MSASSTTDDTTITPSTTDGTSSTTEETVEVAIEKPTDLLDSFDAAVDKETWLLEKIPLIIDSQCSFNFITLYRYLERSLVNKLDLRKYFDQAKKLRHNTVNNVTTFLLDQIKESLTLSEYQQLLDETLALTTDNIILARDLIRRGARLTELQKTEIRENTTIYNHLKVLYIQ